MEGMYNDIETLVTIVQNIEEEAKQLMHSLMLVNHDAYDFSSFERLRQSVNALNTTQLTLLCDEAASIAHDMPTKVDEAEARAKQE